MKRTRLKRGDKPLKRTPLIRRKRIAPRSDRQRRIDDNYRNVRMQAAARDGGHCQMAALIPHVPCAGPIDFCHIDAVGRGGRKDDADNGVFGCRHHHEWCHAHTREARALGLMR